jgi:hypothetical protein
MGTAVVDDGDDDDDDDEEEEDEEVGEVENRLALNCSTCCQARKVST